MVGSGESSRDRILKGCFPQIIKGSGTAAITLTDQRGNLGKGLLNFASAGLASIAGCTCESDWR